jgi:hypothetical protein
MYLKMTEKYYDVHNFAEFIFLQVALETITSYAILKLYNTFTTTSSKKVLTSCWNLSQGVNYRIPFPSNGKM